VDHSASGHLPAPKLSAAEIHRRPATPDDEPFLFDLFCAVRANEFALMPLPEPLKQQLIRVQYTAQKEGYGAEYPDSSFEIVLNGEKKVGRIWIARREDSFHLVDIAILPEAQNSGIGTNLIRDLQREAEIALKPVRLSVFRFNPGSVRFHERLGFTVTHEDAIQFYYEWKPRSIDQDHVV
jgi:ribosomal protein S18 acetylase RimI-like enzyme